jgi:acetyl esterase/lipase
MSGIDDHSRARIRALGSVIGPELLNATAALFAPLALRPTAELCTVQRDVTYGDDARHRLDIFRPVAAGAARPIIVFVPGGGFVRGDKGDAHAPFYNNIGAWSARCGFVGVTINYRLAPAHGWPAGSEDVAAVVAWLRTHADVHGGDPARIFLMGQSAGAVHVAGYVAQPRWHGKGEKIAGAMMLSGIYDIAHFEHSPSDSAYFGNDPTRFAEQSSLPGLIASQIPCLFTFAEYDPPLFQQQAALLVQEWYGVKRLWPHMLYLPDANHFSSVFALGIEGDGLSTEIAAFVQQHSISNSIEAS